MHIHSDMAATSRLRRKWTTNEDNRLIREAELQASTSPTGTPSDWIHIASKISGRTNKDCRKRWSKICRGINKGTWDREEDERLRKGVDMFGLRWTQVADVVGSRHADQCAKRWQNSLDPSVDRSEWTEADDQRLLAAVDQHGQKWKRITEEQLPRRSTNDLKNRYMFLIRKHQPISPATPTSPATTPSRSSSNKPHNGISSSNRSRNHNSDHEDASNDFLNDINIDIDTDPNFTFSSTDDPFDTLPDFFDTLPSLHYSSSTSATGTPPSSYSMPQQPRKSMSGPCLPMLNPLSYPHVPFQILDSNTLHPSTITTSDPNIFPTTATSWTNDADDTSMPMATSCGFMDWELPTPRPIHTTNNKTTDSPFFTENGLDMDANPRVDSTRGFDGESNKQVNLTLTLEDAHQGTVNGLLEASISYR